MGISAVRGAIQVKEDDPKAISLAVVKMFEALLDKNALKEDDIACILFTQTGDLRSKNPAASLRQGGYAANVPLFCMAEAEVDGMMSRVIRVLLLLKETKTNLLPVYLDGAEKLRPDLKK
jgi:chorismate mutase